MTSVLNWETYLDGYEAKIASAESSLINGEHLDPDLLAPFEAPQGLGPFPAELAARATSIIERNSKLNEALQQAMDSILLQLGDIKRESTAVRGYDPSSASVPHYFDNLG